MVSGTGTFPAVDSLGDVDCGVGPLWIRLVFLAHSMDAQLDRKLKAGSAALGSLPAGPCVYGELGVLMPF